MPSSPLNRRTFHQVTAAALGGMIAGATLGCGKEEQTAAAAPAEIHLCRGLNTCAGNGAGGENACAGQGACATVAEHSCGGNNTCKNLGGCGEEAGANACKGQGGCHVPLMDDAWVTVRKRFEERMASEGKEYGQPPAKKG